MFLAIFVLLICLCYLLTILSLCALGFLRYNDSNYKETRDDEAILITGCDSGIGLELAKYFYWNSNYTIVCGFLKLNQGDGFKELDRLCSAANGRIILKKLDLTSSEDLESIVNYLRSLKSLVALINNAGVLTYGEFDWLTWDQIKTQIDVNFIGTVRLIREIMPLIITSKGRIVNVSSVNDQTVFPGLSIYSATKSALTTFSRGLGYELRKFGAHVITVRLGDFARLTNIMSRHRSQQDDMWNGMSSEKKAMYRDYFYEFNRHLIENYGMTSPSAFEESSLFKDFRRALLSREPPATITCAPLKFKIFYFVVELLPVWIQYHLLDLLMQLGFRWNPPKLAVNQL